MWSLVPSDLGSEALVLLLKLFIFLLKFSNAVFERSNPLKQMLNFLFSDHHNSPLLVQTQRDGLRSGDRPSENTLASASSYC